MLSFEPKVNSNTIIVRVKTTLIGEIYPEIDGYFVFEPASGCHGYWDAWILREISEYLDFRNDKWDKELKIALSGINDDSYFVTEGVGYIKGWCVFKRHCRSDLISLASIKYSDESLAINEALRLNNLRIDDV